MTTPRLTKEYLASKEIPQLFECLMTGLMYHRPVDHITYLQECLMSIKHQGVTGVRWDLLLEAKRTQTPLPPITPTNNGVSRQPTTFDNEIPKKPALPSINKDNDLKVEVWPNAKFVFAFTPSGSSLVSICREVAARLPNYEFISVATELRRLLESLKGSSDPAVQEAGELMTAGEMVSDDLVISTLIRALNFYPYSEGFIIHGFPKTIQQVHLFEEKVGPIRFTFIVDYSERQAIHELDNEEPKASRKHELVQARRLEIYKEHTLPTCKFLDDAGHLFLVEGELARKEIVDKTLRLLGEEFTKFENMKVEETDEDSLVPKYNIEIKDIGRKMDVNQLPMILIYGGPGSGKSVISESLVKLNPGLVHINLEDYLPPDTETLGEWNPPAMQVKKIINQEMNRNEVIGFILEGYPSTEQQLNEFNFEIGGPKVIILLDTFEPSMRERLTERNVPEATIEKRIQHYIQHTLGVIRYFDDAGRLNVYFAERKVPDLIESILPRLDCIFMHNTDVVDEDAS